MSDGFHAEMDRLHDHICWNDEIRDLVRARVEEQGRSEVIDRVVSDIGALFGVPAGTAARMVREDQNGHRYVGVRPPGTE